MQEKEKRRQIGKGDRVEKKGEEMETDWVGVYSR